MKGSDASWQHDQEPPEEVRKRYELFLKPIRELKAISAFYLCSNLSIRRPSFTNHSASKVQVDSVTWFRRSGVVVKNFDDMPS